MMGRREIGARKLKTRSRCTSRKKKSFSGQMPPAAYWSASTTTCIHLALPSKIRKLRPRRRKEIFGGQGQRSFSDDAAANGDVAMVPYGCQSQALEWPGRGPYGRLGVRLQLHWDNGREAPSSALRLLRGSCEACVRKPAAGHSSPKKLKVGFSLISSRFQSGLPPPSLLAWDCGCMRAPFAKRKLPRPSIGRIPKKPWFPTVKCACLLA